MDRIRSVSAASIYTPPLIISSQIKVNIVKLSQQSEIEARGTFAIVDQPLTINAQDAAANVPAAGARWGKLPDYGPGVSAMSTFPVTAPSITPPGLAPHLDYRVFFAKAGDYASDLVTNPTLDLYPGRGLSVAVSIDDQPLQVVDVFSANIKVDETFLGKDYDKNTRNNSRVLHFQQNVSMPGVHIVRITMVDPTIVIKKLILHNQPLPSSYFGPMAGTTVGSKSRDTIGTGSGTC